MHDDIGLALIDHVILRRDLIAEGYTDSDIQTRVRSGDLHRIRHGSYIDAGLWASLDDRDRHRALVRAVLKRAHPSAVATHLSGGVEHGAEVWGLSLDEVDLTRTDGATGRREAGVRHHRGQLDEDDVQVVNGVRVAPPARCAVEITTLGTVEPALVAVNSMLHAGRLTLDDLARQVESMKHWPQTLTTTIVERLADPRIQSVAESRTVFLCWDQHLPKPEVQVPVCDEHGRVFAYADFAWQDLGVFLEFDGRIKYLIHRREGETIEEYVLREKRREEQICLATGWVCIRITWADLENPVRTAARIRRILESRRGTVA